MDLNPWFALFMILGLSVPFNVVNVKDLHFKDCRHRKSRKNCQNNFEALLLFCEWVTVTKKLSCKCVRDGSMMTSKPLYYAMSFLNAVVIKVFSSLRKVPKNCKLIVYQVCAHLYITCYGWWLVSHTLTTGNIIPTETCFWHWFSVSGIYPLHINGHVLLTDGTQQVRRGSSV